MATTKYGRLKEFDRAIANAVRYALGESGEPDKFKERYAQAAAEFSGGSADAMEGFVLAYVESMVSALDAYKISPNNPENFEELAKAIRQLNIPRDVYAEKVPDSELKEILSDEEFKNYSEAIEDSKKRGPKALKRKTLLTKLLSQ